MRQRTSLVRFVCCALLAAALGCAGTAAADFLINETTDGDQRRPDVGTDAAGNFVVVWAGDTNAVGYDPDIFARRYDAEGLPLGPEFKVNTDSFTIARDPRVAVEDDGQFFIVWSAVGDGQFTGIGGRRYDADGTAQGPDFVVNSYTTDSQLTPRIANLDDDEYVVVWAGFGDQDGDSGGIFGQRFDAGGPAGAEFMVNGTTADLQQEPRVARSNATGGFVAIYEDYVSESIRARRFNSSGIAQGLEFTAVASLEPTAMDSIPAGGFVVVWGTTSISAQRFDAVGATLGDPIDVKAGPSPRHAASPPGVAVSDDGSFLFLWEDDENFGRRYDAGAEATGDAFIVNSYTTGFQARPVAAGGNDADFVVVWHSFDQDGEGYGSFGRLLPSGNIVCPPTAMDTAGCKDTGRTKLDFRNKAGDAKDSAKWSASRGQETLLEEFGDPVNATPYAACLYADGVFVKQMSAPAGTLCSGKPCWRAKGGKGFSYRDRDDATTVPNGGTNKVSLRPGDEGDVKLQLRAKGPGVAADAFMPLGAASDVTFQFINAEGECWSSSFTTEEIKRDDLEKFQAKN